MPEDEVKADNKEATIHKTTISWFIDRANGAKETFSQYVTRISTSPLSWVSEEDLHNLHLTKEQTNTNEFINPQQVVDSLTDKARNFGERKLGTTGRVILGGVTKAVAATGVFVVSAIAAVGVSVTKGGKKTLGSTALLGNMVRQGYNLIEDDLNEINKPKEWPDEEAKKRQLKLTWLQEEFNTLFEKLREGSKDLLQEAYFTPLTPYKEIAEKADLFREKLKALSEEDKEKFAQFEKAAERLIEEVIVHDNYLKSNAKYSTIKYGTLKIRKENDEHLSKIPGVAEARKNVKEAHSFISRLFKSSNDNKPRYR